MNNLILVVTGVGCPKDAWRTAEVRRDVDEEAADCIGERNGNTRRKYLTTFVTFLACRKCRFEPVVMCNSAMSPTCRIDRRRSGVIRESAMPWQSHVGRGKQPHVLLQLIAWGANPGRGNTLRVTDFPAGTRRYPSSPDITLNETLGWSGAGLQGRGKRDYPEETRRQAASSSTIPTCESPGVNPPRIEPGSPWWEESALATAPPLPH
ncbi:hypothetical protein PR048_019324 [Dryococelus australis]|uniref:Uncharacterized protein n=1 Tax=Dryococelus australis TaxID=614101 RepID=A0ABQ9H3I1_9NEOP|nr:hypothetical protein PR048_019324 [Dryococelus australis]